MHPVVWWIATAVVLFILELMTASFFFLWIGAGAVLTALLSVFVETAWIEYATFAGSSILLVALSRRWAPRLSGKSGRAANVDALIGQTAIVTKVEKSQPSQGYVKVNGEAWKAQSVNQEPLKLNEELSVVEVRGNILMVKT
ncbi:MAG TPA: NfeD family protein [bacterium]|jgi:membrane protein implicated in regulation of membrane protease activity|nr:NfeD family protein [bacterium]